MSGQVIPVEEAPDSFPPMPPRGVLYATVGGLMLTLLLAALDQTIVGTAMPRIVAELQGFDHYAWVTTAYLLTSTTVVPLVGRLGDLYGRKRFLIGGAAFFLAASALCGLAQDMTQLILFRGLQGMGGGVLMSTVFASIGTLFPPSERARVQGLFSAVFALSSIVGPLLGGYLTDSLSWRWVFYVNLPVGIAALTVLWFFYRDTGPRRPHLGLDYLGAATLTGGLVPLLLALSWGGREYRWDSAQILGLFAFACVMLALFVVAERRAAEPILPLELFRNDVLSVSTLGVGLMSMGMFGTVLFVPLFAQGVLGATATESGTVLMPMMLAVIGASLVTGQIIARTGTYKLFALGGLALAAGGMILLSRMGTATDYPTLVRNLVIVGLGIGPSMPVFMLTAQSAVRWQEVGVATSLSQFSRSIGGTLGAALFGSLLINRFSPALHAALPANVISVLSPEHLAQVENPQVLLNPQGAALVRASLAPETAAGVQVADALLEALRTALASSLRDVFLAGAVVAVLAVVVTCFLREIPLRGRAADRGEGLSPPATPSLTRSPITTHPASTGTPMAGPNGSDRTSAVGSTRRSGPV